MKGEGAGVKDRHVCFSECKSVCVFLTHSQCCRDMLRLPHGTEEFLLTVSPVIKSSSEGSLFSLRLHCFLIRLFLWSKSKKQPRTVLLLVPDQISARYQTSDCWTLNQTAAMLSLTTATVLLLLHSFHSKTHRPVFPVFLNVTSH